MLLCADADDAAADLASGVLACPSCGTGRLRAWGYGRERIIRALGGERRGLRPRRGSDTCGSVDDLRHRPAGAEHPFWRASACAGWGVAA